MSRPVAAGRREAARYLDAALAYLQPKPPVVLAVGGLPGTGKSTLARALAPAAWRRPRRAGAAQRRNPQAPARRRAGAAPAALGLCRTGQPRACWRRCVRGVAEAAAAGHAAIADATFLAPADRTDVARAAGRAHFLGVWLQAPLAVLEARVAARHGDASDADVEVLRRAAPADTGPGDWLGVDATDAEAARAAVQHVLAAHP